MPLPAYKDEDRPLERLKGGFNPRHDLALNPEFLESIATRGVLSPPWVTEDGRVIAGNRRIEAARRAGFNSIRVRVFPASTTEAEIRSLNLVENLHRSDLAPHDVFVGLIEYKAACPEMTQKDIAKAVSLSEGMLSNYFALVNLCPEAMEAFKAGKIGVTKAYKIATAEDQMAKLAFFLNGGTREEDSRKARKAKPVSPGDLAKRIALPPVGKAAVTIAAIDKKGEVSLDDALEAVQEAARQIKAAQSKGISARTAAAYFKDIAAAG
jgi:ParB/RepB/Spo0J family partition protein